MGRCLFCISERLKNDSAFLQPYFFKAPWLAVLVMVAFGWSESDPIAFGIIGSVFLIPDKTGGELKGAAILTWWHYAINIILESRLFMPFVVQVAKSVHH
jgi:hypothetical protein